MLRRRCLALRNRLCEMISESQCTDIVSSPKLEFWVFYWSGKNRYDIDHFLGGVPDIWYSSQYRLQTFFSVKKSNFSATRNYVLKIVKNRWKKAKKSSFGATVFVYLIWIISMCDGSIGSQSTHRGPLVPEIRSGKSASGAELEKNRLGTELPIYS